MCVSTVASYKEQYVFYYSEAPLQKHAKHIIWSTMKTEPQDSNSFMIVSNADRNT